MAEHSYDAIVVGSGATGGWAAKELTEAGLRVLVLDAGPEVTAADARPRSGSDAWQARRAVQSRHGACNADTYHLFVDDVDHPYTTPDGKPFDWIRARAVGGRTLLWGGVMLRLSDLDFKAASRDGYGEDWPIGYRDLEPFYDEVETFLGVCGTAEGVANVPDGKYVAPSALTAGEQRFKHAVERRWPERHVMPGRAVCHDFDEPLDPARTHLTSTGSTLAAARATGKLELRPDAVVRRILVDPATAKACGVAFLDAATRVEHEVRARVVLLCASTIESIRLLFNSATPQHAGGIGGSSGLLGHYLMDHTRVLVLGICPGLSRDELGPAFRGSHSMYVPRFRNVGARDPRFLRGYQTFGAVQRRGMPAIGGGEHVAFALSLQGEQLAEAHNRVTIDPARTDLFGIPVARIDCTHSDNDRRMAADAIECGREMAAEAGFEVVTEVATLANPGWLIHEVGGARMGDDPRTSVVNRFHQVWDCPNVFVMDGAVWVSGGCQNPTLTMMALALRASRYLVGELRRGEL